MDQQVFPAPPPAARAVVRGDAVQPGLAGEVLFSPFGRGSLVIIRLAGMPAPGFFGFHIHERGDCSTGGDVAFSAAGGHYDPHGTAHPWHSGDLPSVLASADGVVVMAVYTDRFRPGDVVGRAVVLHEKPDDFRTQPAGDSGRRLACGVIQAL